MVSTGWRTACAVIVIIIGAALLTFAVFVYHRHKYFGRAPIRPEMRQRFPMSSQADDPEAHMSLLNASEMMPPVPPKTPAISHGQSSSGGRPGFLSHDRGISYGSADELGDPYRDKPRFAATRVPVPPMFPEPEHHEEELDAPISMPEPSLPPSPSLLDRIQFPRIQLNAQGGRKGRIPSLKISFIRESDQMISSAGDQYRPPSHLEADGRPPSASSGPSSLSRPFATMSASPLPPIRPFSPLSLANANANANTDTDANISIHAQSPSTRAATPQDPPPPNANWESDPSAAAPQVPPPEPGPGPGPLLPPAAPAHEAERLSASSPTSITTDNFSRNLFRRNPSTDGSASSPSLAVSRGSSYQTGRPVSMSDVARHSSLSSGSGSGSGSGSRSGSGSGVGTAPGQGQGLRRATTWVPNVLASYSPWHNVVPMPGSEGGGGGGGGADAGAGSPTGQLRAPDAYRPMPTLEENPSEAATATATASISPITLPRSLPESTQGSYANTYTGTGLSVSVREVRLAGGRIAGAIDEERRRPSMESVAESVAHVQAQAAEVLLPLPSPYDAREPSALAPQPSSPTVP